MRRAWIARCGPVFAINGTERCVCFNPGRALRRAWCGHGRQNDGQQYRAERNIEPAARASHRALVQPGMAWLARPGGQRSLALARSDWSRPDALARQRRPRLDAFDLYAQRLDTGPMGLCVSQARLALGMAAAGLRRRHGPETAGAGAAPETLGLPPCRGRRAGARPGGDRRADDDRSSQRISRWLACGPAARTGRAGWAGFHAGR